MKIFSLINSKVLTINSFIISLPITQPPPMLTLSARCDSEAGCRWKLFGACGSGISKISYPASFFILITGITEHLLYHQRATPPATASHQPARNDKLNPLKVKYSRWSFRHVYGSDTLCFGPCARAFMQTTQMAIFKPWIPGGWQRRER